MPNAAPRATASSAWRTWPSRHPWRLAFALPLSIALVAQLFFPVHFRSADDACLIRAVSGSGGFVDLYTPFLTLSLHALLSNAYQLFPQVPWYGLLLYLSITLGWALFFHALWESKPPPLALLALTPLVPWMLHSYITPIFTEGTLLLEFGAFASLLSALRQAQLTTKRLWLPIAALSLAIIQRWLLASYLLVLFPAFFAQRKQWRTIALCLLIPLSLLAIDRLIWHTTTTPSQRLFTTFNDARTNFHDTLPLQRTPTSPQALQAAGWRPIDYLMFRMWVLYDTQRFNAQNIRKFLALNKLHGLSEQLRRRWSNLQDFVRLLLSFLSLFALSLLILLFAFSSRFSHISWHDWLRGGMTFALWTGLVLYLMTYRLPLRVAMPLFTYGLCWLFIWWSTTKESSDVETLSTSPKQRLFPRLKAQFQALLIGLCAALILGISWDSFSLRSREWSLQHRQHLDLQRAYKALHQALPRLRWMLPLEHSIDKPHFFHIFSDHQGIRDRRVFPHAMWTQSLLYRKLLHKEGLPNGLELLKRSLNNQEILYLGDAETSNKQLWERYLNSLALTKGQIKLQLYYKDQRKYAGIWLYQAVVVQ